MQDHHVYVLTHWGRVTHICVVKLTINGSDNGLSPGRRQAIIWTNAGILLIGPLGTSFIEILIGIQTFSFKKMHLKMSSVKWHPFCLGLNVLNDLADGLLTTWINLAVFPVLSIQISIAPRFIKDAIWIATVILCCPQADIREMERIYGLGSGHVTPWYTRSAWSCDADSAQVSLSFRVWHTFANWRKHMKYAHGIIMTSQWVPWHLK